MVAVAILCQNLWAKDEILTGDGAGARGEFKIQSSAVELLGEVAAQVYAPILPADESIEWQVFVSAEYDPAKPAGLLVYVSPQNSGRIPREWEDLMTESNLIWIAANQSGNKVDPRRRLVYSLLAVSVIAREYRLDQSRIYISGFSGGGRIASIVATSYPDLFDGAIYNCGVNFWDDMSPESLQTLKDNRFVFITGSEDFNRRDTKRVFKRYQKAGIRQLKLMVIPHMGHSNPGKKDYAQAISFLDNKLPVAE
jgi:hypothetical protein